MNLVWRWPNGLKVLHLSESGARQALCGQLIAFASEETSAPERRACDKCRLFAETRRLEMPPIHRDTSRGDAEMQQRLGLGAA